MTKAEWISVIQKTLKKVDEQGVYHDPLLERHIQSVYEQMFNELYSTDRRKISQYTTVVTESVTSSADLSSGRALPKVPIVLPRVGGGVFDFYITVAATDTQFVINTYEGYRNASKENYDTARIYGMEACTIHGNKIYADISTGDNATLTYIMIPKFTSLASTDEVRTPGGAEDHFIDRIIDTIQHMPPTDLLNDNTI
jgi:hypothetical protein